MKHLARLLLVAICGTLFTLPALAGDSIRLPLVPFRVPIIVPEPPLFLLPPTLGFRVAVDTPHDLFEVDNRYYAFQDNVWFVGAGYNGPWRSIQIDLLPPGLRRHHVREIHRERDREHSRYRKDGKNYHGRTYRPEREHRHSDERERGDVRSERRDNGREQRDERGEDNDRGREHSDHGKHKGQDQERRDN